VLVSGGFSGSAVGASPNPLVVGELVSGTTYVFSIQA